MRGASKALLITTLLYLPAAGHADNRIVAGRRIGEVKIGDTRGEVRKHLGAPARSYATHGKRPADLWRFGSAAEEMEVVYASGKAVQVRTSVAAHRTKSAVGPQSPLADARRVYRRTKATHYLYDNETGNGLSYYDDVASGIAFVAPFPWKDASKPERVYTTIVHRPGMRAIPTDIQDPSNQATVEPSSSRTDKGSLTGDWLGRNDTWTFKLWLIQNGKDIYGTHDVIMAGGKRTDSPSREEGVDDTTIDGKVIRPGEAEVTFHSGRDEKAHGKARLRLVRGILHWDVIGAAPGDHLFPYSTTLKRQRIGKNGPISEDFRIKPGDSIGRIALGLTTVEDAHRSLGRPAEQKDRKDGIHEETWYGRKSPEFPNVRYRLTILFKNKKVEQIEVTSPDYKTKEGLSTSSRFAEIVKRHPRLKVAEYGYDDLDARGIYSDDVAKGIAFFVGASDDVLPEFKPESIIVHRHDSPVIRRPGGVRYDPPELDKTGARKATARP